MQSLDEKVWQAIEIGWTKPKEAPADWDDVKIKTANFNSRALNALFSAVTNEEFKKISSTESTKEAWTILQITYEGTKVVKDSKLKRLTTSFEEIKTTFTLALVEHFPRGQGLDRQGVFIKIAPTMVIMTDFVDRCKIGSNSRNS